MASGGLIAARIRMRSLQRRHSKTSIENAPHKLGPGIFPGPAGAFLLQVFGIGREELLYCGTVCVSAEMLNFGTLIAFMGVNAAALTRYYMSAEVKKLANLVPSVAGFLICPLLWLNLSWMAKVARGIGCNRKWESVACRRFQSELG
jgi:hypothetical protein